MRVVGCGRAGVNLECVYEGLPLQVSALDVVLQGDHPAAPPRTPLLILLSQKVGTEIGLQPAVEAALEPICVRKLGLARKAEL